MGLFNQIADRLGARRARVTKAVTLVDIEAIEADIDNSLAVRRAAREEQDRAHDAAWTQRRADLRRGDPILPHRDSLLARRGRS